MAVCIFLILTALLYFSEGFHIFGVLRTYEGGHEDLSFQSGQYFILERDPFVEKHITVDEVWDEFKYDAHIDDSWSRIHFSRDQAEIFGGKRRELGMSVGHTGFGQNHFKGNSFYASNSNNIKSIPKKYSINN
jgi:hypothetical protein